MSRSRDIQKMLKAGEDIKEANGTLQREIKDEIRGCIQEILLLVSKGKRKTNMEKELEEFVFNLIVTNTEILDEPTGRWVPLKTLFKAS